MSLRTAVLVCIVMLAAWWGCFADVYFWWLSSEVRLVVFAVGVVASAAGTAIVFRRRRLLAGITLALSPVVVAPLADAGLTVRDYVDGSGYVIRVGLPSHFPRFSLEPDSRIPIHHSGCVTSDLWDTHVWINNHTSRSLIAVFGPQSSHYDGPLYTDDQLRQLSLEDGLRVGSTYLGEQLVLEGRAFALPESLQMLLESVAEADGVEWFGHTPSYSVTVVDDRLVLIHDVARHDAHVDVYDLRTGWGLDGTIDEFLARERPDLAPAWQRDAMAKRGKNRTWE